MSAGASPDFACSSTEGGLNAAWVHVAGALDIATTPTLARTLDETQKRAQLVVLDLRDLTFMDSAGVHTLVDASASARQLGRRLILLRGSPNVDRLFALTGSAGEVEIGDVDLEAAPVPPQELQRSLVSRSLLNSGGEHMRGRRSR
jgi:anti-anti-sigma factor